MTATTDFDVLAALITRDNALDLLRAVACPYCGSVGRFQLFDEIANNGIGIQCIACDRHHPFIRQRIMWLRGAGKRRSNDIATVMRECGSYCYSCSSSYEELSALGIGFAVHHTQPFADHGEQSKKIPLCAFCHEVINALQRTMQRLLKRGHTTNVA